MFPVKRACSRVEAVGDGGAEEGEQERRRNRRDWRHALAAAAGVAAYGTFVAPRRVVVTEHAARLRNLPPALDGLRVVQISDVHLNRYFQAGSVRRAADRINACRPDLVVLTGDFVHYRAMRYLVPGCAEFARLRAPLGVYACLGNHDHWENAPAVRRALDAAGVRVLVNESVRLEGGLWLGGLDDLMAGDPDLEKTVRDLPGDAPLILLSHNPTVLPEVRDRPWLVLAGHTHGGQLALPFLGPRGTSALPGVPALMHWYEGLARHTYRCRPEAIATDRYSAGWYRQAEATMYVNRGIGAGGPIPLRLNCRPEIACFTLRS